MNSKSDAAYKLPKKQNEIETYITELKEKQNREAIFARITAGFNTAMNIPMVLQTLQQALHDLGYKYLSIWERRGNQLYWNLGTVELPQWLINSLPKLVTDYIQEQSFDIWVPLDCENIYSMCYHQQVPQSTLKDDEIIECLYFGRATFNNLPDWLKRAGFNMMSRIDVRDHNAFPLGKYGIVFLSNPISTDSEKHKAWVQIILQQAEVAIARVQAVDKLKESRTRFQALFERTNDAVFILSTDLIHLMVNQQAADMLGYSVDELTGMPAKHVVAPEEWKNTKSRRKTLDRGEIPPIYRRTFIRKDGTRVFTEVSVAMVYDKEGKPSHIQSIARDITEREKIQEQLHLQSTALEAAANGIIITDQDGAILWGNRAMTELSGYTEKELIGNNPKIFNSNQQSQAFYQKLWDTIANGSVWQGEIINKHKNGSLYTEEMTITPVIDTQGRVTHFIAIKQDVSQRVQVQETLEYLATHDTLTNLVNRSLFRQRLEHATAQAKRNRQSLAVLFIDLDDFKPVNDIYGHEVGDLLLQEIARRLEICIRDSDTAARFGGDEFTILLENIKGRENASLLTKKVLNILANPFMISGHNLSISASIGISIFPDDSLDAQELLKYADQAMYATKKAGKKGYQFFTTT